VQFIKGNLLDVILPALADSGLSPDRLQLEIADVAMLEAEQARHLPTIQQLKITASRSSSMVAAWDIRRLATSRAFHSTRSRSIGRCHRVLPARRDHGAVVASVVALAHGLGIAAAAKGVEATRSSMHCRPSAWISRQGYLFGRPVPHCELDLDAVIPVARNVA